MASALVSPSSASASAAMCDGVLALVATATLDTAPPTQTYTSAAASAVEATLQDSIADTVGTNSTVRFWTSLVVLDQLL